MSFVGGTSMLGPVSYVTNEINNQEWNLDMSGLDFEDYIADVIGYALRPYYPLGLTIERAPRTRDNGKDLIIRAPIQFSLFDRDFSLNGKNDICVYVEFKSSRNHRIGLDRFSKNILLANSSKIDYFVLITNTSIVPFSYYEASRNAEEYGYRFYLVDQFRLACFLKTYEALRGNYNKPTNVPSVSVQYQIDYGKQHGRPYLELYLLFSNNTVLPQICHFKLKSDRNWSLSETQFDVFLEEKEAHCRCICITKEHFDGINDILISLTANEKTSTVVINGDAVNYNFETPLVGEKHKSLISEIVAEAHNNTGVRLINLKGEAGIGKTRIISEVAKQLERSGMELFYHICAESSDHSTMESITNSWASKIPQISMVKLLDLSTISDKFKQYVFIIEDIHNADKQFFSELKELAERKDSISPVTVITAGRDDYTVYNESYFSFLSWVRGNSRDNVAAYSVYKLQNNECKNLIRAIIKGAPEYVIDKILLASENNPFYIAQFIEYLLETKLIYLLNRNTVGISNITSFSQKIYIPQSVEALLEKRYAFIGQVPEGDMLQTFLLLLCLYGIEAPKSIYHQLLINENYSGVPVLYETHFLKFTSENNITFDHENIFLFLRKKAYEPDNLKKIASLLFTRPKLLDHYPLLQQAMLYFYGGNIIQCEKLLEPAITEIRRVDNISSCNLNPKYLDAYEVINRLACSCEDKELQKKTLLAWAYLALHNCSVAKGGLIIEKVTEIVEKELAEEKALRLSVQQMQAHFALQTDRISEAKKYLLELIAYERKDKSLFDDKTRFDLFDRISSVYTQENHKAIAESYNQLSYEIARNLCDNKLLTLSTILDAKIHFYEDTPKALSLMQTAEKLLKQAESPRISCHNQFGILTANFLLNFEDSSSLKALASAGKQLLSLATDLEYPSAIIRGHYLLATLTYLTAETAEHLEQAKIHIEAGITDSIRNGMSKLMPLFYCLSAIIAVRENQAPKTIYEYYQTMLKHMRQCDQFFLGALDFTYSNIILLTNYAIYLNEYGLESELYQFLSEVTYYGSNTSCDFKCGSDRDCYYSCWRNMDIFKKNYKEIQRGGLLFVGRKHHYPLRDKFTPFYIPIGV